jgi:glutathione synthase/RimK-type ligase-like ATP-grasp enzyme
MGSATKNKWLKYLFLKNYAPLTPYVSETMKMSQDSFWTLLKKYHHVIVKPVWGSRGRGVIQVSDLGNDKYGIHYENKKRVKEGKEKTYRYIKEKIGSADYMVQQRINRPTIKERPFDMRVIVQRKKDSSRWVATGKVIKVAGKGYIVSNNSRSKGNLYKFRKGIKKSSISHLSVSTLESEIDRISILSAERLKAFFPGHRIYGLDIATDQQGHVFIIESNLFPSMSHFRKLKDRSMYRRITRYKRS